jgi:hypothetical protein
MSFLRSATVRYCCSSKQPMIPAVAQDRLGLYGFRQYRPDLRPAADDLVHLAGRNIPAVFIDDADINQRYRLTRRGGTAQAFGRTVDT